MTRISKYLLVAVMAAVCASGCAATCEDACTTLADCGKKYGMEMDSVSQCAAECEVDTSCSEEKMQEQIDCLSQMKCENETQFVGEMVSCISYCNPSLN